MPEELYKQQCICWFKCKLVFNEKQVNVNFNPTHSNKCLAHKLKSIHPKWKQKQIMDDSNIAVHTSGDRKKKPSGKKNENNFTDVGIL